MSLRQYQVEAIEGLRREIRSGKRRVLLQAPTGSGKTIIAAEVIRLAVEKGNQVLFLAHRRELVFQAADKLRKAGLFPSIIMSGEERDYFATVSVASVQTLWARAFKRSAMDLPTAQIVVIDEAHLSMADTYQKIIESYPKSVILGMTATPIRTDGRGLGEIYQAMVRTASVKELTAMGFLVPVRYFAPTVPDLRGVKITAGDYNSKQLEERMDDVKLVGDVVENWARIAKNRPTVVFASGVKHSLHLRDRFRSVGAAFEHVDGSTPKNERDLIFQKLEGGEIQGIVNCMVCAEGWDCPRVSCCVLARPTKSFGLYLQMAGRVLRPHRGKTDTLLIDHAGAVYEHGRVDEFDDWALEKGKGMAKRQVENRKKKGREITCSSCKFIYWGRRDCPNCGNVPKTFGEGIKYRDGYLYEVGVGDVPDRLTRTQWYRQLVGYAGERKFKKPEGWAAHQYKARFGGFPNGVKDRSPMEPTEEVLAFIRKKHEEWRKNRDRQPSGNVPDAGGNGSPRIETNGYGRPHLDSGIHSPSGGPFGMGSTSTVLASEGGAPDQERNRFLAGVAWPLRGGEKGEVLA